MAESADEKRPTMSNGKVCYVEIPAQDINASAAFYERSSVGTSERGATVAGHLMMA